LKFLSKLNVFILKKDVKYSDDLEDWAKENNILSKSFDKVLDVALVKSCVYLILNGFCLV